jgi:hypothetical protein
MVAEVVLMFGPTAFSTLTLKHSHHNATCRVHHLANHFRLRATSATSIFLGLGSRECFAAKYFIRPPEKSPSSKVKIGSRIGEIEKAHPGGARFSGIMELFRFGFRLGTTLARRN